jgi:hypothetical protein
MDVGEFIGELKAAGFEDIEAVPVYFDEVLIDEAAKQSGLEEVIRTGDRSVYKSVYSAKITALRPAG